MKKKREWTLFDKALLGVIPFTLLLAIVLLFVTKNENSEIKSLIILINNGLVLEYSLTKLSTQS